MAPAQRCCGWLADVRRCGAWARGAVLYAVIDRHVRVAHGETRRGLLRVGAAYAALVGWLYQDAGDLGAASFWWGITQEIAMRSRDVNLVGYSLVNLA
ncbi:hypothetical protein [Actinacidiphila glaucinigra]|uniref:Uncharacterized protein n=1 Tax=Actinacidiphila glaucinigra TaxID=235986 RepID=A0A239LU07_9ACTN|nr:hypothetical protein [Actinacidiphila glaucinigra]SNT33283.1 hypothetical protein SAMN05216252_12134 [Actinacidiphila glaucinigra]